MKKSVLLASILVLVTASALAQQTSGYTLAAKVPFDFIVRGDTLPAGDYTLKVPSLTVGPMMIRQTSGTKAEFVVQVPTSEKWAGKAQLTFHRVGDSYFLMEISDPRFGVQRVQQGKNYNEALKMASAQTVVVAARK